MGIGFFGLGKASQNASDITESVVVGLTAAAAGFAAVKSVQNGRDIKALGARVNEHSAQLEVQGAAITAVAHAANVFTAANSPIDIDREYYEASAFSAPVEEVAPKQRHSLFGGMFGGRKRGLSEYSDDELLAEAARRDQLRGGEQS